MYYQGRVLGSVGVSYQAAVALNVLQEGSWEPGDGFCGAAGAAVGGRAVFLFENPEEVESAGPSSCVWVHRC